MFIRCPLTTSFDLTLGYNKVRVEHSLRNYFPNQIKLYNIFSKLKYLLISTDIYYLTLNINIINFVNQNLDK